jgi:hypothetical protein
VEGTKTRKSPTVRLLILILTYLSTAIGLTPGVSTHLHINNTYNITINKTTRITNKTTQITNLEECWPCPIFANYTLAFALQLTKHGKISVRVAKEIQSAHIIKTPTHYKTNTHTHTHYKTVNINQKKKPSTSSQRYYEYTHDRCMQYLCVHRAGRVLGS